MSNELQIIDQREVLGKDFKIYGDFDNPLFLAQDVAGWIEHSKTSMMLESIDDNEKLKETIFTSGQNREMWFVTEDGLYEILMQSRKPVAKEFKREVKEILKSIRKHGAYMTPQKIQDILLNPDTIIQLAQTLKEEQEKRKEAEKVIQVQKPLVTFAETCLKSKDNILVRELAKVACDKGCNIGQNRLYDKLREWKLIMKGSTEPYQSAIDSGWFKVIERPVESSYGTILSKTTVVTPKGQVYIIERLLKECDTELIA